MTLVANCMRKESSRLKQLNDLVQVPIVKIRYFNSVYIDQQKPFVRSFYLPSMEFRDYLVGLNDGSAEKLDRCLNEIYDYCLLIDDSKYDEESTIILLIIDGPNQEDNVSPKKMTRQDFNFVYSKMINSPIKDMPTFEEMEFMFRDGSL